MDFSVIVASRNRPVLVRAALQSVFDQAHPSVEIILVDDGSNGEYAAPYAAIKQEFAGRVKFVDLPYAKRGHGQSGSLNCGAEVAQGTYLCFLDDDDFWTDPEYLSRAWAALTAPGMQAEVYFANQKATLSGVPINGPIWLEPLEQLLTYRHAAAVEGAYAVSIDDLMRCPGFGHLNTTIIARGLYERIGGMDENIRYECDRDFYLRLIDRASGILYCPQFVSHHNAPDPTKALNMSTTVSYLEKMLFRAYVWNKARLFSDSRTIRRVAAQGQGYTLRQVAIRLKEDGRARDAFNFGLEALGAHFSFKWLGYCGYLAIRAGINARP